ncbi:site-specific integrase [Chryseobacterium fistulae]|uniref:Tyrosine recombinase XerD n=1 Tax=Chryseobacterium fistulae TaxID=2675058 RepID=A0A6N4XM62_9FLAO|nr:site-specific integrase [Chryseobacterium fistulae]CAA7386964.1 Tyrosine recombinase XerD [Chryseobacterium fistulae]
MNTSIKIVLDSRPMSNSLYTVYLRIIKDRKRKNIALGLRCKKEYFENEQFLKGHSDYRAENNLLISIKARANQIIRDFQREGKSFSLEEFENKFRDITPAQNVFVATFFDEIIDELERSARIGNAKAYKDTKSSFIGFAGKKIRFKDITPVLLGKYEVSLRERGNENGGISFKMRHLRALVNKAIERKLITKDHYPFDSYKISKLKAVNNKKALSIEEFKKLKDVDLSQSPHLLEAYNYFMFSMYARGMNFIDMMKLKWSDIQDGRVYYVRSKTKASFNIEINEAMHEIITFYKTQGRNTQYVFPILLKDDLTPMQLANRKHKVLGRYNSKLKEIGKLAGIDKPLSSYVARHSFATILKYLGTSVSKISEMMGHSDVQITMSYLKDFENEDLDKEITKLIEL